MSQIKLALLALICIGLVIPLASARDDGAWIEDFEFTVGPFSGDNVTTTVTVGYQFDSDVEINPGIFSFDLDDWIIEELRTVDGSGNETFTLVFPAPDENGTHLYQANVWYVKQGSWYFDGSEAAFNFTIGDENATLITDYITITEVGTPSETNTTTTVDVKVFLNYSITNESDYSISVINQATETLGEEFDVLLGEGAANYTLSILTPEIEGLHSFSIRVESFTGENGTVVAETGFDIFLTKPVESSSENPEEPDTPIEPPEDNTTTPEPDEPEPEEPEVTPVWRTPAFWLGFVIIGAGLFVWQRNRG